MFWLASALKAVGCPDDQVVLATSRLVQVSWTIPKFPGSTEVKSNYIPGWIFLKYYFDQLM